MMTHRRRWRVVAVLATAALITTACSGETSTPDDDGTESSDPGQQGDAGTSTLDTVKDRGSLVCGVNGTVPGFSFVDDAGEWSGFDVEFCKAVAAAVLGDATAVEYRALTAAERFTALQGRQIDALIRNTTWTATRDGSEGAAFAVTTFYDGQGIMVRADSGIASVDEMNDTIVCVQAGTTTELNLATLAESRGLSIEPLTFEENEAVIAAFEGGQCDGFTSDKSQLAGLRSNFSEGPEALVILEDTISKEPLGPVTRDGDSDWFDVVNWVAISTILAEELGVTQANVADLAATTEDPELQRFLGVAVDGGEAFDAGLGLEPGWVVDVISAVGNYGEIYERTVGPDTPLGLPRGLNAQWTDGGLLYAPPYR